MTNKTASEFEGRLRGGVKCVSGVFEWLHEDEIKRLLAAHEAGIAQAVAQARAEGRREELEAMLYQVNDQFGAFQPVQPHGPVYLEITQIETYLLKRLASTNKPPEVRCPKCDGSGEGEDCDCAPEWQFTNEQFYSLIMAHRKDLLAANHRQRETVDGKARSRLWDAIDNMISTSHRRPEISEVDAIDNAIDALIAQAAAQQRERDDAAFERAIGENHGYISEPYDYVDDETNEYNHGFNDRADQARAAWAKFREEEQS